MLSIAVVGASQAVNYYKKDNYYSENESVKHSEWFGKASELIGLSGNVDFNQFAHLINGRDLKGNKLSDYSMSVEDSKKKELENKIGEKELTEFKDSIGKIISNANLKDFEVNALNTAFSHAFKFKSKLSKTQSSILKAKLSKMVSITAENKKERADLLKNLKEEIDKKTLKKERRAGYDLTFSASKSVSIQSLVFNDETLVKLHQQAVRQAIEKCEREFSTIRVKENDEIVRKNTGNLIVASFQHDTSRLLDPQLHTHNVILNITHDGEKWRAISNEDIMNHSKLLGMYYQNELGILLQKNGYQIVTKSNGTFELAQYTRNQVEAFSKRSAQLKDLGAMTQKEATKLIMVDRLAKDFQVSDQVKSKEWKKIAKEAGIEKISPNKNHVYKFETVTCKINIQDQIHKSIDQLSERDVKFSKHQIFQSFLENNLCKVSADVIEKNIHNELVNLIPVMNGKKFTTSKALKIEAETRELIVKGMKKHNVFLNAEEIEKVLSQYSKIESSFKVNTLDNIKNDLMSKYKISQTTKEIAIKILDEQKVNTDQKIQGKEAEQLNKELWFHIKKDKELSKSNKKALMIAIKDEIAKVSDFTVSQRNAIKETLLSKDNVMVWQGHAGSGKTSSVRVVNEVAQNNNYSVFAFSPSSQAANELGTSLNMPAFSVPDLLLDSFKFPQASLSTDNSENQNKTHLWIVDEAGMLGASQANALLKKAESMNARVIFIGDTKQLASVEAGNPFKEMQSVSSTVCYLNQSIRQKDPTLAEAVQLLNANDMVEALKHIKEDYIFSLDDQEKLIAAITNDFLSLSKEERAQTLVTALTNESLVRLNEKIRSGLKAEGSLTDSIFVNTLKAKNIYKNQVQYASSYEVGNIIIFNKNLKTYGIQKNEQYKVVHTDTLENCIQVQNLITGEIKVVPLQKNLELSLYTETKLEVSVGDRLMWSQNDKENQRINKYQFDVLGIDKDKNEMTIKYKNNNKVENVSLKQYLKMNHAWSVTYYAAQGATVKNCLVLDEKNATYNNMYVYLTRATTNLKVYTDSFDSMLKRAENQVNKNTVTELYNQTKEGHAQEVRKIKETDDKKFRFINYIKNKDLAFEILDNAATSKSNEIYANIGGTKVRVEKDNASNIKLFSEVKKNLNELFFVAPQDFSSLYALSGLEMKEKILQSHQEALKKSLDYINKYVYQNSFDFAQIDRKFAFDREGMKAIPLISSSIIIANEKKSSSYVLEKHSEIIKNIYHTELAAQVKKLGFSTRIQNGEIRINKVDRQVSQNFLKDYNRQLKDFGLEYYATLSQAEAKYSSNNAKINIELERDLINYVDRLGNLNEKISFQQEKEFSEVRNEVKKYFMEQNTLFNDKEIFLKSLEKGKGYFDTTEITKLYLELLSSDEFKIVGYSRNGEAYYSNSMNYKKERETYDTILQTCNDNTHYISDLRVNEFIKEKSVNNLMANHVENILSKKGLIKVCSDLDLEKKDFIINSITHFYNTEGFKVDKYSIEENKNLLEIFSNQNPLNKNNILIIDNAHLIGSVEMNRLVLEAKYSGAKLILFGNTKENGYTEGKSFAIVDSMIGINPYFRKDEIPSAIETLNKEQIKQSKNHQEVKNEENERLKEIMNKVAVFYHENMYKNNMNSKEAMKYLTQNRNLNSQEINDLKLGVSSFSGLIEFAKKNNISVHDLEKCGLVNKNQKTGEYYDTFKNRIMFPIRDKNSNVIAFGARIFKENDIKKGLPKYVNSKQTQLFSKSNVLYGLDSAIASIKKEDKVYICEGYMDAIALKKAGIQNAVAVLGTALTDKHIEEIKKYTNNVVLLFDNDKAGLDASIRSYFNTYKQDVNMSFTKLEGHFKDVDEFLKHNSSQYLDYVLKKNTVSGEKGIVENLLNKHNQDKLSAVSDFQNNYYNSIMASKNKLKRELDLMIISQEFGLSSIISKNKDSNYFAQICKKDYQIPLELEQLKEKLKNEKLLEAIGNLNNPQLSKENINYNIERSKQSFDAQIEILFKDLLHAKLSSNDAKIEARDISELLNNVKNVLQENSGKSVSNEELLKYYFSNLDGLTFEKANEFLLKEKEDILHAKDNLIREELKYIQKSTDNILLKNGSNEVLLAYENYESINEIVRQSFENYKELEFLKFKEKNGYNPTDLEKNKIIEKGQKDGSLNKHIDSSLDKNINHIVSHEKSKISPDVIDMFNLNTSRMISKEQRTEFDSFKNHYLYSDILFKNIENQYAKGIDLKSFDSFKKFDDHKNNLIEKVLHSKPEEIFSIIEKTTLEIKESARIGEYDALKNAVKNEFVHLKENYLKFDGILSSKSIDSGLPKDLIEKEIIEVAQVHYKRDHGNKTDNSTALLEFVSLNQNDLIKTIDNVILNINEASFKVDENISQNLNLSDIKFSSDLENSLLSVGLKVPTEGNSMKI